LRALAVGFSLQYEPSLRVEHESPRPPFARSAYTRAYSYGKGNERVLRDHGYPWWFVAYRVAQLVAGSGLVLFTGRFRMARFSGAMAAGRAAGWLGAQPERRSRASP